MAVLETSQQTASGQAFWSGRLSNLKWRNCAGRTTSTAQRAAQTCLLSQLMGTASTIGSRVQQEVSVEGSGQRRVKHLTSHQEKQTRRAWNSLCVIMGFSFVPSICSGGKFLSTPCTSKSKKASEIFCYGCDMLVLALSPESDREMP